MSVNQVLLAGRLKAAPKPLVKEGLTVGASFTLVTQERVKDETGAVKFAPNEAVCRVLDPEAAAEVLSLSEGAFYCVRGLIYTRRWDVEGATRYATFVLAQEWGETLNFGLVKGNLAAAPEMREMGDKGRAMVRFRVGTNPYVRDVLTGEGQEEPHFVGIECFFQRKAEMIANSFGKGDEIVAWGPLRVRAWQSEDGRSGVETSLKLLDFDFGKKRGGGGGNSAVDGQPYGYDSHSPAPDYSEIPF